MSKIDLVDLVKTHNILEFKVGFLKIIEEALLNKNHSNSIGLNSVTKPVFQSFSFNEQKKILNVLFEGEFYDKTYELIGTATLENDSWLHVKFKLNAFSEMGQVRKYDIFLKETIEYALTYKLYPVLREILIEFEDSLKLKGSFEMTQFYYLLEMGDTRALKKNLDIIIENAYKQNILDKNLEIIYEELSLVDSDLELYKLKLKSKLVLAHMGKEEIKLTEKEVYEVLLFATEKMDYLLVGKFLVDESLDSLLGFLESKRLTTKDFLPILNHSKIKKNFLSFSSQSIVTIKNEDELNEKPVQKIDLKTKYKEQTLRDLRLTYTTSEEEVRILRYLKVVNDQKYYTESLLIAFLSLNYYKVAEYISFQLEESSNKYYLEAMIVLKLEQFSKTIELVNFALSKYHLSDLESVPFEAIKAFAFKSLGAKDEYLKIMSLIRLKDPSFNINESTWRL